MHFSTQPPLSAAILTGYLTQRPPHKPSSQPPGHIVWRATGSLRRDVNSAGSPRPHTMRTRNRQPRQNRASCPFFVAACPVPATGSLSLAPGYTLMKTLFSLPFPMLSIPCASSYAHPHGFFAVLFLCFHQNESFAHKLLNFVVFKGLQFYIIYAIINRNYYNYLTILPSGCAGCRLFANSASAAKPQDRFMPFSIRRRAQCLKTF